MSPSCRRSKFPQFLHLQGSQFVKKMSGSLGILYPGKIEKGGKFRNIDELHILRKIGDASGIDAKEIQKLRDQTIVDIEIKNQRQTPIEELPGIDAD